MDYENRLAGDIDAANEKAALDAACKRLLANKEILAYILKACVSEYKDASIRDIADKYIEGEPQIGSVAVHPDETNASSIQGLSNEDSTVTEGKVTYDIRFSAYAPVSDETIQLIINIEAQNDFYPGYPLVKRGLYYCSRMISAQYGTVFENAQYDKIRKVYSIWICMNPPGKYNNSIARYRIIEESLEGNIKSDTRDYDVMSAVMMCLGSDEDENVSQALKLLNTLLVSERKPDEKKQILQNDFGIEMTGNLSKEVADMCNISTGIEARGFKKGIAQGIAQGVAQGKEQGIAQGVMGDILNLMDSMKWSAEQAMTALKVPEDKRGTYEEMLRKYQ